MTGPIDWDALDAPKYADEDAIVRGLLATPLLTTAQRETIAAQAVSLIEAVRASPARGGVVESFLQQFSLGTAEGIALMCLAEALLRVPDAATRDRLIAEKIGSADWGAHLGASDSLFVNASTWGLMLTGRIVDVDGQARGDAGGYFRKLVARLGEPVIREAVGAAVRIMSEQFVLGKTIDAALRRARREATLCSFDMLGEGARTLADADRYERIYAEAIDAVGAAADGAGPELGHGISVKLSALSPRFEAVQEAGVRRDLYPRLLGLAQRARGHDLNFTIDAEEADRTVLTLTLLDRLAREPSLDGWQGLGIVIQAYQKRAPALVDAVAALARATGRRIMVRLVKGAYWDSEIKRAQIAGRPDYPVFTTKAATDVNYLACARALIGASPALYAQFATHNAHTLCAVRAMAEDARVTIEHQRLHGMGEALYDAAPQEVAPDPVTRLEARPSRHPGIALPAALFGPARANPPGRDLSVRAVRDALAAAAAAGAAAPGPLSPIALDAAIAGARAAFPAWDARGGGERGRILRAMGDAIEARMDSLVALLSAEAGKTLNDGVSEVREAVDFCRYYAGLAETQFAGPETLTGPTGETNTLELHGRGVFACISPWNFPLAIFTGQIAAALAAGNAVIAKPAEQTPRIAAEAVRLFHAAGLPADLLTLAPGEGAVVGAALVAHPGIDGVAFTGGTDTAWAINRSLAARPGPIIPFIAETGGLNGMFIDTTALREQVVDDVILSAFGSAGQRCSALRILFVPHEVADEMIATIRGAMDALVIGDPALPETDVGPVIDGESKAALDAHVARLEREAVILHRCALPSFARGREGADALPFFAPTLAEIGSVSFLGREVFGPILHIIRYDQSRLSVVAGSLAATRYGLTLGIHSRLDSFAEEVAALVPAGNVYVNRSMTGAVVGVQPFGGAGLSGTGPKAGGPHALLRYANERAVNITAKGGDPQLMAQAV